MYLVPFIQLWKTLKYLSFKTQVSMATRILREQSTNQISDINFHQNLCPYREIGICAHWSITYTFPWNLQMAWWEMEQFCYLTLIVIYLLFERPSPLDSSCDFKHFLLYKSSVIIIVYINFRDILRCNFRSRSFNSLMDSTSKKMKSVYYTEHYSISNFCSLLH